MCIVSLPGACVGGIRTAPETTASNYALIRGAREALAALGGAGEGDRARCGGRALRRTVAKPLWDRSEQDPAP